MEPIQLQKNVWDLQESCKIMQNYLQACQTFWSFYNFKKMFGTSRHSRSLVKIIQKYLQACQTFWSFYNFRKMFGTSRHSRSLLKIMQKYLQACQTFWSFYNFKNMFGTSRHSSCKYLENILKLGELSMACRSSWNEFSNFRKSWSICKHFKIYSEALGIY